MNNFGSFKMIIFILLFIVIIGSGGVITYRLTHENKMTKEIESIAETIKENDRLHLVNDKLLRIKELGGEVEVAEKKDGTYRVTILSNKGYDHYITTVNLIK